MPRWTIKIVKVDVAMDKFEYEKGYLCGYRLGAYLSFDEYVRAFFCIMIFRVSTISGKDKKSELKSEV